MKKILAFVQIIFCFVLFLTGCPNPAGSGNNDNTGNNGNRTPQKLSVGYMSNFMVDIGDATGLGIVKRTAAASPTGRSVRTATASDKNYLVKTTTEWNPGSVEWNESGLTNVTFKKRTTETVTIPIYDGEGNIIDEETIEDSQTVTQDEIPAQVNRLYAYNAYTFIQFVPVETSSIPDIRPIDLGTPDRDGYYEYDKQNYYNDDCHQSFVIENSSGNIYAIENSFRIDTIHNGLLRLNGQPETVWDLRIKQNGELEIFSLRMTDMIAVIDYYKDKYGNNYIQNGNGLNEIDTSTETIYFSGSEYHVSATGEVLYSNGLYRSFTSGDGNGHEKGYLTYFTSSTVYGGGIEGISEIKIVGPNCTFRSINDNDDLFFNGFLGFRGMESDDNWKVGVSRLKNKKLYFYQVYQPSIVVYDTDTSQFIYRLDLDASPVAHDVILRSKPAGNGNIDYYWYKIDWDSFPGTDFEVGYWGKYTLKSDTPYSPNTLIVQNVLNNNMFVWTVISLNGQGQYTVAIKDPYTSRIPTLVTVSEYMAGDTQIIILKPINR